MTTYTYLARAMQHVQLNSSKLSMAAVHVPPPPEFDELDFMTQQTCSSQTQRSSLILCFGVIGCIILFVLLSSQYRAAVPFQFGRSDFPGTTGHVSVPNTTSGLLNYGRERFPERSVQRVPETPSMWQTQRSSQAPSTAECRLDFSCKRAVVVYLPIITF